MKLHRLAVLAIFLLTSVVALVFTTTYLEPRAATQNLVTINKTSGFQILKATRVGHEFTLSAKNNYAQTITAFVLTVGQGFRITEDFIIAEAPNEVGIRPQQTFARTYPLPSDQAVETVILQAVVLEDKTGDGDPLIYEDIRDTRLGQAVQIKRSLKLLEKYANGSLENDVDSLKMELEAELNRPDTETLTELKAIHPLGTVNRSGQDALSHFVKEGLAAGRADALRKIERANASRDKKSALFQTKAFYENLLTRL